MSHPIYRVISLGLVGTYSLRLQFDDGSIREIDFQHILEGELFGPLRDPDIFAQVSLDPEAHTICWPTGADLDPATLHDWPKYEEDFRLAAQRWRNAMAQPNEATDSGKDSDSNPAPVGRDSCA